MEDATISVTARFINQVSAPYQKMMTDMRNMSLATGKAVNAVVDPIPAKAPKNVAALHAMNVKMKQFSHTIFSMRNIFVTVFAGIIVKGMAETVARAENMRISFANLTKSLGMGMNAALEALRRGARGTVDDITLMESANKAMLLGAARTTEEFNFLAEAGRRLGKATGRTALQGFEDLSVGIGRQSRLILDNLGLIVRAEQSYKDYAAQIGKTVDAMSDEEKKEAFRIAAFKAIRSHLAKLGPDLVSTSEKFQSMGAAAKQGWLLFAEQFKVLFRGVAESVGKATKESHSAIIAMGKSFATLGEIALPVLAHIAQGFTSIYSAASEAGEAFGKIFFPVSKREEEAKWSAEHGLSIQSAQRAEGISKLSGTGTFEDLVKRRNEIDRLIAEMRQRQKELFSMVNPASSNAAGAPGIRGDELKNLARNLEAAVKKRTELINAIGKAAAAFIPEGKAKFSDNTLFDPAFWSQAVEGAKPVLSLLDRINAAAKEAAGPVSDLLGRAFGKIDYQSPPFMRLGAENEDTMDYEPLEMDWREAFRGMTGAELRTEIGKLIEDTEKWVELGAQWGDEAERSRDLLADIPVDILNRAADAENEIAEHLVAQARMRMSINDKLARQWDWERQIRDLGLEEARAADRYLQAYDDMFEAEMKIYEAKLLKEKLVDDGLANVALELEMKQKLYEYEERARQLRAESGTTDDKMYEGMVGGLKAYGMEIENVYALTFDTVKGLMEDLQSTTSSILFDAMIGDLESWKDAAISILKSVGKALADFGMQMLMLGLFKGIAGLGLNIFTGVGSVAGTAGTFTGNAAGLGTITGSGMAGIPLFGGAQYGGIFDKPTLAGEAGTEAVVPLPHGRKIPVELHGGGGGGNSFNVTINALDGASVQRVLYQNRDYVIGLFEQATRTRPTTRKTLRGV